MAQQQHHDEACPPVLKLVDALYGPVLRVRQPTAQQGEDPKFVVCKEIDLKQARRTLLQRLHQYANGDEDAQAADNPFQERDVVKLLQQVGGHRHIVQYLDCRVEKSKNRMVFEMEYCTNGDLWNYLTDKLSQREEEQETFDKLMNCPWRSPVVEERQALRLLSQIASAVAFLHTHGVAHRDLSLENVLLSQNGDCKLMDFGLSTTNAKQCHGRVGKAYYMAPEVVRGDLYDPFKTDVWSLGIILFMLLTGSPLCEFACECDPTVHILTKPGGLHCILKHWRFRVSYATTDLLSRLLHVNPAERITMADVQDHPALCWANKSLADKQS